MRFSLKIASAEPRPDMSPFKVTSSLQFCLSMAYLISFSPQASLLLSVLTVVRAAPQELLAGRVLTHDLPVNNNLVDIRNLR